MIFLDKVKDFIYEHKTNIVLWSVLLLIVILSNAGVYYVLAAEIKNIDVEGKVVNDIKEVVTEPDKEIKYYKFDIKGAVVNPGVYEIKESSRIIDAVNMAGGLLENADTSVNNLSKFIKDEMVIVIYTKDEVANFSKVLEEVKKKEDACKKNNGIVSNDSCISSDSKEENNDNELDKKISINEADLDLMITLPGIGEEKAKTIIAYRNEHGPFEKIEDIMNVSGIGEKLFEKIKDYITV